MSKVKSFSVSNGDMFYIEHNSDSFSVIDCNLISNRKDEIIEEINKIRKSKTIFRFISTHPDEDHIKGLEVIQNKIGIQNFYCVENKATKQNDSDSFKCYCTLRDNKNGVTCYLEKGLSRCYLNKEGMDNKNKKIYSSGISILWPDVKNNEFIAALNDAKDGKECNNISPIIKYSVEDGHSFLWMGDLESSFMSKIKNELINALSQADIVFAPHHGRQTGRIPDDILAHISPKLIVVGEANSDELDYYSKYNHINQNSLGDILFVSSSDGVDIFATNFQEYNFLSYLNKSDAGDLKYIGTLI